MKLHSSLERKKSVTNLLGRLSAYLIPVRLLGFFGCGLGGIFRVVVNKRFGVVLNEGFTTRTTTTYAITT